MPPSIHIKQNNNWRCLTYPAKIFAYLLYLLLLVSPLCNAAQKILIIQGGASPVYKTYLETLRSQIDANLKKPVIEVISSDDAELNNKKADIYVAIGTNAAEALTQIKNDTPKLLGLIPGDIYDAKYNNNPAACPAPTCKVLTLDQPMERQLHVLRISMPNVKNILILNKGPPPRSFHKNRTIAKSLGFTLNLLDIKSNDALVHQLRDVLPTTDILLALPNTSIYNSDTARPILLVTYKVGTPIFAFSKSFIDAGATLGVYSTPEQYAKHAAELIVDGLVGFKNTQAHAIQPKYFTIGINRSVAESLNLNLPDINHIYTQLESKKQ